VYAKVFSQIYDSSIVEKPEVRFTFMDLLVLADQDGVVDMTHEAIARRTNRPVDIIRSTIAELEAPDPQSRTPDALGARLKRLDAHRDWGWCIINFDRFHKLASDEQRRAKNRERVNRYRQKTREKPQCNAPVTPCNAESRMSRHTDTDTDTDKNKEETDFPPCGGDHIPDSGKKPPGKPKPTAEPKPPEPRPRNIWWDAICDIFGMKPVTKQDQSRLGKLSRDFKLKCEADGAAPDEIDARREVLSIRWAKNDEPAVVTPEALLKHWDSAKEVREDPFDIRPVTPEEEAQMQAEVDAIPEADFIAQYHAWIARVSPDKISRINPRAVRLGLPIPPGLTLDKDGFVVNPVVQEGAVE